MIMAGTKAKIQDQEHRWNVLCISWVINIMTVTFDN